MKKRVLRMSSGEETRTNKEGKNVKVRDEGYAYRQALATRRMLAKGNVRMEALNDKAKASLLDTLANLQQMIKAEGKDMVVTIYMAPVRIRQRNIMGTIAEVSIGG